MLKELSLQEFLELAKIHKRVAVFREILADKITPISIMESLTEEMKDGAVLESALQRQNTGRYSFLAFGVMGKLLVKNYPTKKYSVQACIGDETTELNLDPLDALRELKNKLACGV